METSEPHRPAPRWARRKQARPAELLDAALDLFVERGYAATRLEDVAARAGVSKGTLYLYFAGKEDLFQAVVRQALVPSIARGEEIVGSHRGTSAELLRELVWGWWELIGSTRAGGLPKLIFSEARNFPEIGAFYRTEVIDRGLRMFARVIERGISSGEFRPLDVPYATRVLLAPMIFALLWRHSIGSCCSEPMDMPRYLETHLDMATAALRAPPAAVCLPARKETKR